MHNFSIRQTMLFASMTLCVAVAVLLATGWWKVNDIEMRTVHSYRLSEAMGVLKDARFHVSQIQQYLTDVSATGDSGGFAEAEENLAAVKKHLKRLVELDPSKKDVVADLQPKVAELHAVGVRMAQAYIQNGTDAGNRLMQSPGGLDDLSDDVAGALGQLADNLRSHLESANQELVSAERSAFIIMLTFTAAILAICIASMVVLYQKVIPPLSKVKLSLVDINRGDGDLTRRLAKTGNDEVGAIVDEFNRFVQTFRDTVGSLTEMLKRLTATTEQIFSVTEHTNRSLGRQQRDTEMVATAINQMSATVQEVANSASGAAAATQQAHEEANKGRRVVGETMSAIDALADEVRRAAEVIQRLEQDSDSIGAVLDVIRDIADQTNLLALNAAIEAARAGEQGRGFAVVADEVRTLASRTQQSTQEIQEMISRLQNAAREAVQVMDQGRSQAETSVEQAANAGTSLDSIAEHVATINDMNSQIASAAEEQSAAAEDINRNIESINAVAEETAEGSSQAARSAQDLVGVTQDLQELVKKYKI